MRGHSITGGVTGLEITGNQNRATHGTLKLSSIGVKIDGGSGNRLTKLEIDENNFGLFLQSANANEVADCTFSQNNDVGVQLFSSSGNTFRDLLVEDTFGTALQGGFYLRSSDQNSILHSKVLRNFCTGIMLEDSSRNVLALSSVQDSKCFGANPAVNVALVGASVGNILAGNQLSATSPGSDWDGLNIGCKGGCAFQGPTTGASGNFVLLNKANDNARYGFAQGPGNTGNVFLLDQATGNGVANFAIDP